jgi:sugar phosphate isomerase/epimerase
MVGGQQSTRRPAAFRRTVPAGRCANLLEEPELATRRMKTLLGPVRHRLTMGATSTRDHRWLSINTATVSKSRGADLRCPRSSKPAPAMASARSRPGATRWRPRAWRNVSRLVRDHGLALSAIAAVGCFPRPMPPVCQAARDDNRRGGRSRGTGRRLPGAGGGRACPRAAGKAAHKDIALARGQVRDGICRTSGLREAGGMPLAIEPLHPMYAAGPRLHQHAGTRARRVRRTRSRAPASKRHWVWPWTCTTCGGIPSCSGRSNAPARSRLLAFHVCDWLTPTTDLLNDRGMMGDGVIDIPRIRGWVEAQGFAGYSEVEIFSTRNWWQKPHEEVLDTCIARHKTAV